MTSAMLGGRDVADSPIDLTTADVSDVIVTMSAQVTTLSGPVVDAGRRSRFPRERARVSRRP